MLHSKNAKKSCRGFYVISQNILPTSFEIDQIQNIIDIGNWFFNFQELEQPRTLGYGLVFLCCKVFRAVAGSNLGRAKKFFFQIKYTRDVKSMIRVVESKQKDKRRWIMTIYIDSTYQKRKICGMVFWVFGTFGRMGQVNLIYIGEFRIGRE
jgi:hypothetical protein